jgi:hypothetical protein
MHDRMKLLHVVMLGVPSSLRRICVHAARWQVSYGDTTVGLAVLDNRGLFKEDWWRWMGMAVLLGYAILFNILVLLAQTYLGRKPLVHLSCFECQLSRRQCPLRVCGPMHAWQGPK